MLVLSRKVGQRILIGDKVAVTVVRVGHGGVRIGIEAPSDMQVVREELAFETDRPSEDEPSAPEEPARVSTPK